MNILYNIWLALSSPNQVLIAIILCFATFIENFLILQLYLSLVQKQVSNKRKILYVISLSTFNLISLFLIAHPYNIFINYFLIIFLQYILLKNKFIKSVACSVLTIVIFNLICILILNPFVTFLKIPADTLNVVPIYRLLYLSCVYAIAVVCILVLKYKHLQLKFSDDINNKHKLLVLSNLFFGIFAIMLQSIILVYYVDTLPVIITVLGFISLLAYFAFSFFSLTSLLKLILTTKKLESAEAYNRSLQILHDNVRGFKHDFDNTITTIGGYIMTNDMDGLKKYYSQLQSDCQKVNNLYLLNPSIVNNDGIYNLITKKYQDADDKNIKVNMSFLLDLKTLNMPIYEFARILGILLDNAIEASSETKDKIINLTFRNDFKSSRQLVVIENTFNDNNLDTEQIYEKGTSSKENHTGLGLWTVRKIIKKHNNINLFTSKQNNFFLQQLEIYY